ncbi:MAG: SRPBCC family protein [Myxococcaceae bacterium]
MAMEITKTFTVKAAPAAVWTFLTDPQRVARCLPGAAIGEQLDDKTYTGTMTVKVGPVSSSYKGKVTFERLDPSTRTAEIRASGQDIRGKGGAELQLTSSVRDVGGGQTEVTAVSQVNITGLLAQMGRGMVQDVSDQIFQMFSERMRSELEAPANAAAPSPSEAASAPVSAAAPALDVVALGGTAARRAAKRLAQRPVFWVAVLIVVALLWFVLSR